MKEKTYFSTIAFKFFPTYRIFVKNGMYTHPIDLSCHRPEAELLAHDFGKYRPDPTLRMREIVHARSGEFPRTQNDRPSIRTYSLWKGDIFPLDHFTGSKKSNQNQFGRVLPFADLY